MSNQGLSKFSISSLIFGFGFLYVPILILIVYSFNDSRLVTVWSGFSFKSYVELKEKMERVLGQEVDNRTAEQVAADIETDDIPFDGGKPITGATDTMEYFEKLATA